MWNTSDEQLYGWTRRKPSARTATSFSGRNSPVRPDEIERELLRAGQWLGELTHTRRDGTPLVVASHWVVQRDEADAVVAVLEVNKDITDRSRAREA